MALIKRTTETCPDPLADVPADARHIVVIEQDGAWTELYEWDAPCDPETVAELAEMWPE